MFEALDPILHTPLRLAVMSVLLTQREAEFNDLKERTQATAGNLSAQLSKLQEAGYIIVTKEFRGSYPLTRCTITPQGVAAFEKYVAALQSYLRPQPAAAS